MTKFNIPGWKTPDKFKQRNHDEFVEFKKYIQEAGFIKEEIRYTDPGDNKEHEHTVFNKIKIPKIKSPEVQLEKFKQKDDDKIPKHIQTLNHLNRIDSFFNEYAKILWIHTQLMQPGVKKFLTDKHKEYKEKILKEDKKYLGNRGYSKQTINSVMILLEKNLDKKIENYFNTKAGKGIVYPDDKHETRPWLDRENVTIYKLKSLYEEFTELSERQIQLNMALVFEKINFWPHERKKTNEERIDRYVERIKKRYQKIKKRPFAFELDENSKGNLL